MLHAHCQHLGIDLTELSPGLGAARLSEAAQTLPPLEAVFDLPTCPQEDQCLLNGRQVSGHIRDEQGPGDEGQRTFADRLPFAFWPPGASANRVARPQQQAQARR